MNILILIFNAFVAGHTVTLKAISSCLILSCIPHDIFVKLAHFSSGLPSSHTDESATC